MATYKIHEVAELAGISIRQLQYWDKTGLIKSSEKEASGRGIPRIYSEDDVTAAQKVGELRKKGVSLQKIRKAVARLESPIPGRNVLAECNFTTDGKNVFALEKGNLVDISSKEQLKLLLK